MKTKITLLLLLVSSSFMCGQSGEVAYTVFDEILFYDGYAETVAHPVPEGVIRHRNDLYAKKITAEQLASFGNQVTMNVTIKAACDNYDRIGNVNLAFVPKGQTTYNPGDVQRIEVGRYITPFMNKNISPTEVPYTYSVDNLAKIFKDPVINDTYDIWAELEVFGVPYAANTQVTGCSGRNDVFYGTLEFVSTGTFDHDPETFLLPLSMKANFNNYQTGATDEVGTTQKTITFELEETIYDAKFHLITSNHGAGSGGEEYVRRWHYVYFNGPQVLSYRPGGLSCEPFRVYNTQGNGIYGTSPQSAAWWANWNNWCPGDKIPIREISLGTLDSGTHTFVISVPAAQFLGQDGNFPLSLYLQGSYSATASIEDISKTAFKIYPNPASDIITIESSDEIKEVMIFDMLGKKVSYSTKNQINISGLVSGIYFVHAEFENNAKMVRRIVKK